MAAAEDNASAAGIFYRELSPNVGGIDTGTGTGNDVVVAIGVTAASADGSSTVSLKVDLDALRAGDAEGATASAWSTAGKGGAATAYGIRMTVLETGAGDDVVYAKGTAAADTRTAYGASESTADLGEGDDSFTAVGSTDGLAKTTVRGGDGDDTLDDATATAAFVNAAGNPLTSDLTATDMEFFQFVDFSGGTSDLYAFPDLGDFFA